mgnify:CR=1 FL=1
MSIARRTPLAGAPDRYDGIVGLVALLAVAYAFLVAFQPILGITSALAFLCVYAAARTGDVEHTAVVVVLWGVVFVGMLGAGFLGLLVAAVLAVLLYFAWRAVRFE